MKIAIVGTGIAGNYAAHRLARDHEITVYESADRIGGHTNTIEIEDAGRALAVDTGFIVYNDRTYPNFIALLDELGVDTQPSDMGFSVSGGAAGLEYNGSSLNGLFAQRRNLFNPRFYRMLSEILRFNREAPAFLEQDPLDTTLSLGGFLGRKGYSTYFTDYYILPMGSAIWSATPRTMRAMPAAFFFRFFQNHGLLTVNDHPQWRVIKGGSARYLEKLVAGHRDRIRTSAAVREIRRDAEGVEIRAEGCDAERFDRVFVACHSDQALAMLADASKQEREVLGAIPYQRNEAVLHNDTSLMPAKRRAWAAWNYNIPGDALRPDGAVTLTYNMNILQTLDASTQYCVTLNNSAAIDPDRILRTVQYEHPVFTERAVAAQKRHREIDGERNTYFCGAYWRYGFHEDGVVSAIDALRHFSEDNGKNGHEERNLLRTA